MNLFENGTISLYERKNPENGKTTFKVVSGSQQGELTCSGSMKPAAGQLIAEYDYAEEESIDRVTLSIFRVAEVFRGIETLGSCRRCRNAVKGDVGSKRVVFCKALMLGGCGQYGFVECIEEECARYEDNGYDGIVFDTERLQVAEYEKKDGSWVRVADASEPDDFEFFTEIL